MRKNLTNHIDLINTFIKNTEKMLKDHPESDGSDELETHLSTNVKAYEEQTLKLLEDIKAILEYEDGDRAGTFTMLEDKNGKPIMFGDTIRHISDNGVVTDYLVEYKTIKIHEEGCNISITGVVLTSNGDDYLPTADDDGTPITRNMEVIKNA